MNHNKNECIQSVIGALSVLELMGELGRALSLGEIANTLSRPKGSVHRVLSTLMLAGYVRQNPETTRYEITLKAWRIGASAIRGLDVVDVSKPVMGRLSMDSGETAHLALLDFTGDVVYVSRVESPQSLSVQTRVGQLSPSWCTATGRCLLAFNQDVAERVLSQPLRPKTSNTLTDSNSIRRELNEARRRGYCVTRAENHPELGGIAAPVFDHTGKVVAACGVGVPAFRLNDQLEKKIIPLVVKAASEISLALGYSEQLSQRRNLSAA